MYPLLARLPTRAPPVTITVKVFRVVNRLRTFPQSSKLDFILVDREGTKIHATVQPDAYHRFSDLPEGSWVQITGLALTGDTRITISRGTGPNSSFHLRRPSHQL
ncbi:unnamed protein product [Microthlaspi erraticum]|uniref:Replication protein A 70 kDa DNA-binding subunit B/D first OB fold domain-containing protein n=1 Tax=Microthlaspi erraticum TaxID=1685480 RepID=A0A6D2I619_9BRAS|nr:unnamed protein product [Microthlaspi erraticum]